MIRKLLAAVLLMSAAAAPAVVLADDAPAYSEGHGYKRVPKPLGPADANKIGVEEFFWYGCPHCYHFEPLLADWRKKLPADVKFTRIPSNLGHEVGEVHEHAFYIADFLGIEAKIHQPLMDALVRDRKELITLDSLRDFFVSTAHIKPADFDGAASNFIVGGNIERADQLSMEYRITGVPTLVIDGTYVVEPQLPEAKSKKLSPEEVENMNHIEALKIADFLIKKERAERKLK
jgi:thiol:disulfide interchange protein DsbA